LTSRALLSANQRHSEMSDEERTDLANDRTVLSWSRTALTCILGGAAFAKLGGRDGNDQPDKLSLAVAFFLFASGLWLMWNGWRASNSERIKLGLPRNFSTAADSVMIIVSILCVLVFVWALRLR